MNQFQIDGHQLRDEIVLVRKEKLFVNKIFDFFPFLFFYRIHLD